MLAFPSVASDHHEAMSKCIFQLARDERWEKHVVLASQRIVVPRNLVLRSMYLVATVMSMCQIPANTRNTFLLMSWKLLRIISGKDRLPLHLALTDEVTRSFASSSVPPCPRCCAFALAPATFALFGASSLSAFNA